MGDVYENSQTIIIVYIEFNNMNLNKYFNSGFVEYMETNNDKLISYCCLWGINIW